MSRMSKHSRLTSTINEGTILKDRFTTTDVFERIIQVADEEVYAPARELFFSALAAGLSITLTFFLYASMYAATDGHAILKGILYPLGFVYIVLGGYQLFTENTLPPVALLLERLTTIPAVARVWGLVLLGNFVGGGLGAVLLTYTGVFSAEAAQAAITLAQLDASFVFMDLFWRGAFAGLIVASVVWLDYGVRDTISRFVIVYTAFLAIPLTGLKHVVITATEMVYLYLTTGVSLISTAFLVTLPVLLGNIAGGVILVTAVNYFQKPQYLKENPDRKIPIKQWLFGMDRQ